MSVTLNTRKLLGSNLTAEQLVRDIRGAVLTMDEDAEEMGVRIDWSSVVMKIGDDYAQTSNLAATFDIRQPYLEIGVGAERMRQ